MLLWVNVPVGRMRMLLLVLAAASAAAVDPVLPPNYSLDKPSFLHSDIAIALENAGRREEAYASFVADTKHRPASCEANTNLGVSFMRRGDLLSSARQFAKSKRLSAAKSTTQQELSDLRVNMHALRPYLVRALAGTIETMRDVTVKMNARAGLRLLNAAEGVLPDPSVSVDGDAAAHQECMRQLGLAGLVGTPSMSVAGVDAAGGGVNIVEGGLKRLSDQAEAAALALLGALEASGGGEDVDSGEEGEVDMAPVADAVARLSRRLAKRRTAAEHAPEPAPRPAVAAAGMDEEEEEDDEADEEEEAEEEEEDEGGDEVDDAVTWA